jgi:hypothetical protein
MPRFQPLEQPADVLDMGTCSCGARIPENASWCPVCLRTVVDRDDLLVELHDTFREKAWSPPRAVTAPRPPAVHSRWRAGPRSFGLRVKLAITIVSVGVTAASAKFLGIFSVAPLIGVTALLMRATWARERIR